MPQCAVPIVTCCLLWTLVVVPSSSATIASRMAAFHQQRRFWYIYYISTVPRVLHPRRYYGIYTFVAWMSHEGELLQELCHLQYRKASQVLFILHTVSSRRGCFSCWCRDIGAEQSQQTVVIRVISSVDCVSWYEHEYEHGVTVTSYQYRYEYSYAIRRTVQSSTVQYSTVR